MFAWRVKTSRGWERHAETGAETGLSTGLRDRRGEVVYEGDILEEEGGRRMLVCFGVYPGGSMDGRPGLGFYVRFSENREDSRYLRNDFLFWKDRSEVIGNIHESPELMK